MKSQGKLGKISQNVGQFLVNHWHSINISGENSALKNVYVITLSKTVKNISYITFIYVSTT